MTIALSERGRSYLERARALGPLLDASAAEIEESRDIPAPVFERLVADDMFRMLLPEAYGGAAIEPSRMLTITTTGTDAQGLPVNSVAVSDKQ